MQSQFVVLFKIDQKHYIHYFTVWSWTYEFNGISQTYTSFNTFLWSRAHILQCGIWSDKVNKIAKTFHLSILLIFKKHIIIYVFFEKYLWSQAHTLNLNSCVPEAFISFMYRYLLISVCLWSKTRFHCIFFKLCVTWFRKTHFNLNFHVKSSTYSCVCVCECVCGWVCGWVCVCVCACLCIKTGVNPSKHFLFELFCRCPLHINSLFWLINNINVLHSFVIFYVYKTTMHVFFFGQTHVFMFIRTRVHSWILNDFA